MVTIGNGNFIHGTLRVISIEGEKVIIGDDNLFSDDILIRNGDSHSVLNENGNRINSSKEICIGNHNWFCEKSTILKDVIINDNTIIGYGAVVTKSPGQSNIALGGNPAKILKSHVNWDRSRFIN